MSGPENPLGLSGVEFVEFATPDVGYMDEVFLGLGFSKLRRHQGKDITLYQQNAINFLLNDEAQGPARNFSNLHGPSISAMGWRVGDADFALSEAVKRGARAVADKDKDLPYAAIYGIGGSLIYLIDRYGEGSSIYATDFVQLNRPLYVPSKGFVAIDHLTNNVHKGTMADWVRFYECVFGFTEERYFDIQGKKTGLTSYALRSPDGSFCIPINEGDESASQIEEYLRDYAGPGVQHLAFLTEDILQSLDALDGSGIEMLDIGDDYYLKVFDRFPPKSDEFEARIRRHQVLIDGNRDGILLQIFTKNLFGPIFFEIIQRNGCLGFGEGNFQALFESIERDQERRQVV